MFKNSSILTYLRNGVAVLAIAFSLPALSVSAQTTSVSPSTASDSLANPLHGINILSCVEVFNWEKYVADQRNNITNSNPYDKQGCLRQENLAVNGTKNVTKDAQGNITSVNYSVSQTSVRANRYRDFNGNNNTTAKAALGDAPVLGIFPNGNFSAQALSTYNINGSVAQAATGSDRTQLGNIGSIYTAEELNRLYAPGTNRTGAPRIVFTGRDRLVNGSYDGGTCTAANGKMTPRSRLLVGTSDEVRANPSVFGDPSNPIVTCRWTYPDGRKTDMVIDQNMEIYQFVYVINYPTAQQCQTLFDIPPSQYEANCLQYFRDRLGKNLAGRADGSKFIYTLTYYGMFADSAFRCQTVAQTNCDEAPRWGPNGNWKNPDINGPRRNYSTTATEQELRAFYGAGYNNLSLQQLQNSYNGLVRSLDGYSVYVL